MRTREQFGAGEAAAFLRDRFDDAAIEIEPLVGGTWSQAFAFRHAGEELVARFGRQPDDYGKDRRAATWATPELLVPTVLDVEPVDDDGWWCAVSTRAFGTPLEAATPAEWAVLVPRVIDLISRCAALPYEPTQGVGRWGPDGLAPHATWREFLLEVADDGPDHRIHGWRAALAHHPEAQAAFDAGLVALERVSVDLTPPLGVVHADVLNSNVLVDGGRITAVLDWGSAMYGDPLHDVAWIAFWAPWHPNLSGPALLEVALADERLTAGGDVERRLQACRLHIALGHLAYHAWAGHPDELERLAAITRSLTT